MPSRGPAPPDFLTARNRRQKARAAGLHPDYWYAVEYDRAVRPGQTRETRFWNTRIAIHRDRDGRLRALPVGSARCYPLEIRYGLIWLFPGDRTRAAERRIPDIPELE